MKKLIVMAMLLTVSGCVFVKIPLTTGVEGVEEHVVEGKGRDKVALIDVAGMISLARSPFSKAPPLLAAVKEELKIASEDERIKGVVLRLDSSGGGVTASDILYQEVMEFRRKKQVPVVVCVMDKSFSGGYYMSLAADEIMAHPTSVIGGIGVISFKITIEELLQKWGVEVESVKSGPLKDFWSPLRQSRPEETALMQEITDRLQKRFLGLLKENRKISEDVVAEVAKGGIFDAGQALEMGLIDRIGYLDDAISRVKELAGIDEARVVIYKRPGTYSENIYAAGAPLLHEMSLLERAASEVLSPSFRYQYLP